MWDCKFASWNLTIAWALDNRALKCALKIQSLTNFCVPLAPRTRRASLLILAKFKCSEKPELINTNILLFNKSKEFRSCGGERSRLGQCFVPSRKKVQKNGINNEKNEIFRFTGCRMARDNSPVTNRNNLIGKARSTKVGHLKPQRALPQDRRSPPPWNVTERHRLMRFRETCASGVAFHTVHLSVSAATIPDSFSRFLV